MSIRISFYLPKKLMKTILVLKYDYAKILSDNYFKNYIHLNDEYNNLIVFEILNSI